MTQQLENGNGRHNTTDSDDAKRDLSETTHEAVEEVDQIVGRIIYAGVALGSTVFVAQYLVGLEAEHAREVAVLNAGIAYYSHAATGRVLRALVVIFRNSTMIPVPKRIRRKK